MTRIAVLDDDSQWCFAIKRYLRDRFDVFTFTDTDSFLISPLDSYDLVLMDFSILPIEGLELMNGYQILEKLKRLPDPPLLVLVSGFFSQTDSLLYNKQFPQADAILTKDLGLDTFVERLQALVIP